MLGINIRRWFLSRLSQTCYGELELTLPDGSRHTFTGSDSGVSADIHILSWRCILKIVFQGSAGFGDAWVKGLWTTSDLQSCLEFFVVNYSRHGMEGGFSLAQLLIRLRYALRSNTLKGSKRNITAHYDLGNDFYKVWLDGTMSYSSGIFTPSVKTLREAQDKKLDRILQRLQKNSRILEIGCGWGGFIQRAVSNGHAVHGITLSRAQASWVRENTKSLGGRATVSLQDYREVSGKFDAVVSIEMYEAVGEAYWRQYFSKIAEVLTKNGTALIQAITIRDSYFPSYRRGTDFVRSYIFPGGMLASKRRFCAEAEAAGLRVIEVFSFGKSYARTLETWLKNFDLHWHSLKELGFDEHFARIWRFYLAGCRASFVSGDCDVSQIHLTPAR